jgi:transposase
VSKRVGEETIRRYVVQRRETGSLDPQPAPTVHPGQIVGLDNLSVHKQSEVRQVIESAGCHLLFLPAYSLDFNSIEMAFGRIRQLRRRCQTRTTEALIIAIDTISPSDASGFLRHCG